MGEAKQYDPHNIHHVLVNNMLRLIHMRVRDVLGGVELSTMEGDNFTWQVTTALGEPRKMTHEEEALVNIAISATVCAFLELAPKQVPLALASWAESSPANFPKWDGYLEKEV